MIFLDTCVWIELLGVRTPVKPHEIRQVAAASKLLNELLRQEEAIITCKEQLIELITAIEKVTMRSVSRIRKDNNLPGINNLKQFRGLEEFQGTKELCETVLEDLQHFAVVNDIGEYNIDAILQRLDLADINDCLYYDYCTREEIEFYTFDVDLSVLGNGSILHRYDVQADEWI